jgi:hypothetical protein
MKRKNFVGMKMDVKYLREKLLGNISDEALKNVKNYIIMNINII